MFILESLSYKQLKTHSSANVRMQEMGLRHLYCYNVPSEETQELDKSFKNEDEAQFVVKLYQFLNEYLTGEYPNISYKIAVISPYRAQNRRLQELLGNEVEVMTADGAQGSEKDFVIFSCVRSGNDIGFLSDKWRLNVALSRAKRGLYIVGNLEQIAKITEKDTFWRLLVNDVRSRGSYYDVNNGELVPPVYPRKRK